MNYLLKAAKILDKASSFNQQRKDILIENGIITAIDSTIDAPDAIIVAGQDIVVSKGWVDLKTHITDPGEEYKETIENTLDAAAFGGFTHICSLPTTHPVTDNKTQIEYQLKRAENHLVQLHPFGAVTKGIKGEEMAEYYDMQQSGAVAFTDDMTRINSGILYRSLFYSKTFGAKIVTFSNDSQIGNHGIVNEGITSALTGLKPTPSVAEWIDIERNIRLATYTGGNLHLTGVTTAHSVDLIRKAKAEGISVTADVHVEHLIFTEEENMKFDSNYKFFPVLRTEEDRKALWKGLKDGTIDNIVSNHRPCDTEEKEVVFDDASFGTIRLQTVINELALAPEFDLELVLDILSSRNRLFLYNNDEAAIEIGQSADLTIFEPTKSWLFNQENLISGVRNTYMLGKEMHGEVIAVINRGQIQLKD